MRRAASISLCVLSLIAFSAHAQTSSLASSPAPTPRVIRDIPYVPNAAPRQRLDLYLQPQPSGKAGGPPRPLIVYIHGGAWRAGSKSESPARRLLPLGYDVASIEYRFSQDAPYPAQIQDCKAAIRWLRAHAKEFNIDPAHICAWGASAGGHLVTLLGVTGRVRNFDTGPNLDQSSAVQCVIDDFGPTDFLHYGDIPKQTLDAPDSAIAALLGGTISTHLKLARAASPIYFVAKDSAPFIIFQGDKDPLVPEQQSQSLDTALKKAGVESTLVIIPGGGHGGPGFNTPAVQKQIVDFLNAHLKPRG